MLSYNRLILALGMIGLSVMVVNAQSLVGSNPEEAKKIVEQQCAACHGLNGEGVAALPNQAKLAGQHESYIMLQLQALKNSKDASGSRFEMTMSPQASLLSDQDMANVAAYYSQQVPTFYKVDEDFVQKENDALAEIEKAKNNVTAIEAKDADIKERLAENPDDEALAKEAKALPREIRKIKGDLRKAESSLAQIEEEKILTDKLIVRGEQIYYGGDMATRVPACAACHSPSGKGNSPAAYPSLIGQTSEYLVNQLENFKMRTRTNDPAGMMRDIAERMSDKDIKAVSTYIKYMEPKQ